MTGDESSSSTADQPQNPKVAIPLPSFATVYLEMAYSPHGAAATKDDQPWNVVANGTGFFYRAADGQVFILTARHNLTGKHWETGEFLSKSVSPTHLRVLLRNGKLMNGGMPMPYTVNSPGVASTQFRFAQYQMPLVDAEDKPTWLEHPSLGPRMDAAAIPFNNPDPDNIDLVPLEGTESSTREDAKLWVTQDVSIPGYPFGLHSGPALPLWIRGSVASEPQFFYDHRGDSIPAFLVDARTRKGSSGSPVVLIRLPGSLMPIAGGALQYVMGTHSRLLGVYTGRISDDSDLGFVWHIQEAMQICQQSANAPLATEITTWGMPPLLGGATSEG